MLAVRTCIQSREMPHERGFFLSDKELFRARRNPDGLQGKPTRYGGKKTVRTALSGCEYRTQAGFGRGRVKRPLPH